MNSMYGYMDFERIYDNPMCRMDYPYLLTEKKQKETFSAFPKLTGREISYGYTVGKMPTVFNDEGTYYCVRSENLKNREVQLDTVMKMIDKEGFDAQPEGSKLFGGEFLMVSAGARSGYVAINHNDVEAVTNEAVTHININEDIVDKEYLIMLFEAPFVKEQIENMRTKGATPNFKYAHFKHLVLPIPEIKEQIATLPLVKDRVLKVKKVIKEHEEKKSQNSLYNIIDKVMHEELSINQAGYVLDRYNQVNGGKTNIIYNSFDGMQNELDYSYNTPFSISEDIKKTFEWVYLNDLLDVKISTGAYAKKIDQATGYCRIMVKNLSSEDEHMKTDDVDNISETDFASTNVVNHLKYGDILFSGSGAGGIGNMVINLTKLKGIIDTHVGIIRLKESVNQLFMYYFLTSYLGQQQILRCVTGTTGQISLNLNKLKKIVIPVFSEKRMEEIIDKINQEKQHSNIYDEKINKLQQLLDSSIDRYVLHGYDEALFDMPQEVMM